MNSRGHINLHMRPERRREERDTMDARALNFLDRATKALERLAKTSERTAIATEKLVAALEEAKTELDDHEEVWSARGPQVSGS